MKKEIFEGQWNQIKGQVKEKWGKLSDDDLKRIEGKKDQLIGYLQKRYGYTKDVAEKEVEKWAQTLDLDLHAKHRR